MLLGLTYQLIRFVADLVLVRTRSVAKLRAEVLVLRHQLQVLERRVGQRVCGQEARGHLARALLVVVESPPRRSQAQMCPPPVASPGLAG
ncbi:MAG TPA: hypothetical protein VKF14_12425 [Candidatus Dormibacteraeota bacterium]|nr:hypothetical protein [Candidatus Dormibacteraeota bacterium]